MKNITNILIALSFFVATSSQAATTLYFDMSNDLGSWSESAGGYGTIELWTEDDTSLEPGLHVRVVANDSFFNETESGMAWSSFYFNLSDEKIAEIGLVESDFHFLGAYGDWGTAFQQNKTKSMFHVSMFGDFENQTSGTAGVNGTNPLEFYIDNPALTIEDLIVTNEGGWLFAGHLKNFEEIFTADNDGISSTKLAVSDQMPPVPIPGSFFLFGSGLVALVGMARKRQI